MTDFDSLRKVREYFHQIRGCYRKLKQNIEAVQRQNLDGSLLNKGTDAASRSESQLKETKGDATVSEGQAEEQKEEGQVKKRPFLDKQQAFLEYKTGPGKSLEQAIIQYREEVKEGKHQVKILTATINATKQEMDRVQGRLV